MSYVSIISCLFFTILFAHCLSSNNASIVSVTKIIQDDDKHDLGEIRYHLDSAINSCSYVLLLGVGEQAMRRIQSRARRDHAF